MRARPALAVLAVMGGTLLTGCQSQPSAKAVANDIIESLNLPDEQAACMTEVLEGYSKDELQELGDANKSVVIASKGDGDEAMQKFIADLTACQPTG